MNDLIFKIIEIVVYVLFAAAFRYLIPWITTQLKHSKYDLLAQIIEDAVYATEQTIKGDGMGEKRKAVVMRYAIKACEKYNIALNGEQIDMLIESAVKGLQDA